MVKTFYPVCIAYPCWPGFPCVPKNWTDGHTVSAQLRTEDYLVARLQCIAKRQESSSGTIYADLDLVSTLAVRLYSKLQVLEMKLPFQRAAIDVDIR